MTCACRSRTHYTTATVPVPNTAQPPGQCTRSKSSDSARPPLPQSDVPSAIYSISPATRSAPSKSPPSEPRSSSSNDSDSGDHLVSAVTLARSTTFTPLAAAAAFFARILKKSGMDAAIAMGSPIATPRPAEWPIRDAVTPVLLREGSECQSISDTSTIDSRKCAEVGGSLGVNRSNRLCLNGCAGKIREPRTWR